MSNISDFFKRSNEEGLNLPMAKDSAKPGHPPSATLFFMYVSNVLAILSLIVLHIKGEITTATIITGMYGIIWVVLYLLRTLQKAKFDLDDKSIELEGDDEKTT